MNQLNRILLYVHPEAPDLSLVDRAANMAKKSGAAIKVLHVISDYPEDISEWWNVRNPQKLHDKIVQEREGFLNGLADQLRQAGVEKVSVELKWGVQFLEIIHEVQREKHDLVMITAQRAHQVARTLMECPSMDLMRHCPCALWVSKGKFAKRTKRILAAIGWRGGERAGELICDAQTESILRTAALLAKADSSELHVVHTLPLFGGKGRKGKKLRSDLVDYLDNLRQEIRERCLPGLAKLGVDVTDKQVHLLTGTPSVVIPDFIVEAGIDLVVLGTVARTGIPGLFIGNTAEKVFSQVDCPVVAVKPSSFVSLVEKEEMSAAENNNLTV